MTEKLANWLHDACREAGVPANVYHGYSGRGMYGSKTTGLTFGGDFGELLSAALEHARYNNEDLPVIDGAFRTDDMGRGTIIY